MKTVIGPVVAAVAASACCLGPVLLSLVGAGALSAAASRLAAYRPYLLGVTFALLGIAFFGTYRRNHAACGTDGCAPASRPSAKVVLWVVTILVALLAAFPYYVNYLW